MSEDNIVRPQSPFQEKYLKSNAREFWRFS